MQYKRGKVEEGTFAKYLAFQKQIANFFKNKAAISIYENMAENFCDHLAKTLKLEPITVWEGIAIINACWEWTQTKSG